MELSIYPVEPIQDFFEEHDIIKWSITGNSIFIQFIDEDGHAGKKQCPKCKQWFSPQGIKAHIQACEVKS